MSSTTATKNRSTGQEDFLPLLGTDYIEFRSGNAKQAAHYYINAFGFAPLAYMGPETGVRDKASYVVRQNKLTFVLTAAMKPGTEIAEHVQKHGDGVRTLALLVDDARKAWMETTARGEIGRASCRERV